MDRRLAILLSLVAVAGCGASSGSGDRAAPGGTPVADPVASPALPAAPFARVGVLYVDSSAQANDAYVVIVRASRRLPGAARGAFWIGGPNQTESGHDRRPTRAGVGGSCYVAYFYADEADPEAMPRIFPLTSARVVVGYRDGARAFGGASVAVKRTTDGIAGAQQAALSRHVGCR